MWIGDHSASMRSHHPQCQPHRGISKSGCDHSLFLLLFLAAPKSRPKTPLLHTCTVQEDVSSPVPKLPTAATHSSARNSLQRKLARKSDMFSRLLATAWPKRPHVIKIGHTMRG